MKEGKGTAIELFLPVSLPEEPYMHIDKHRKFVLHTPMNARKHILVADDERLLRKLTKNILTAEGYEVTTCSSGEEALETFKKDRFDLVILDMVMPGLNGVETFRRLAAADPSVKVIIISGYSKQKITNDLYDLGLAAFLEKPVPRIELLDRIQEILLRDSLRDQ